MRHWKTRIIEGNPRVGFAVASYLPPGHPRLFHAACALYDSLRSQTYLPATVATVHDGPPCWTREQIGRLRGDCVAPTPPDFIAMNTPVRENRYGHPGRAKGVTCLMAAGCDWLVLTNQDNYYMPTFVEWMVADAQEHQAELLYCDLVHSHERSGKLWQPMCARPDRGHIDLGSLFVSRRLAQLVPFEDVGFASDWAWFDRLRRAAVSIHKVDATLFVHN